MEDLNQFGISKTLGSKIKQVEPVGFGNFSSVSTTEEIQKALRGERAARGLRQRSVTNKMPSSFGFRGYPRRRPDR